MTIHKDIRIAGGIHLPISFTYADSTAREAATGMAATDLYKFAIQTDDNSVWMLTVTTPTWIEIGGDMSDLVDDTTPELGGNLDCNDKTITDIKSIAFNDGDATITEVKDEDAMGSDSATMICTQQSIKAYVDTQVATQIANVVEDTTPQLGGDLDTNSKNIDFTTTANISDCLDEDDMATDSATVLATQQSIKAYTDSMFQSSTVASDATPNPIGSGKMNHYSLTALAAAAEFAAPSGTPADGNRLSVRIEDDGTGRALTYNAIYEAKGVALPTTTTASKTLYIGFLYNATDSKWDCVSSVEEA